jgi:hypothetical protein
MILVSLEQLLGSFFMNSIDNFALQGYVRRTLISQNNRLFFLYLIVTLQPYFREENFVDISLKIRTFNKKQKNKFN